MALSGGLLLFAALASNASAEALTPPADGAVAVGTEFAVGIKSDGTVWTWGASPKNALSALGLPAPAQVTELTGATGIAMGDAHALVLLSDRTVRAWGSNNFTQLGDGTFVTRQVPIQPVGLGQVTLVAAGSKHSLARKADGTVWAWGSNDAGQLGEGSFEDQSVPVLIPNLTNVVAIAGGKSASAAVKADGSAWWWGTLPGNSLESVEVPTVILSVQKGTAVAVGDSHILILCSDGRVLAMGGNSAGQLGNGSYGESAIATPVPGISDVVAIAAGSNYSAALRSDGTVWAWGGNGLCLTGSVDPSTLPYPVEVSGFTQVVSISASKSALIAIRQDGSVISRGTNRLGLSGDGFSAVRTQPLQLSSRSDLQSVAACANQVILLTTDGGVLRPGGDGFAAVGGLSSISAISLGITHSVALRTDGTVWSWGNNSYGELGNGTTKLSSVPVQVVGLDRVACVDGGMYYASAMKSDGTVWSWGQNGHGELGDGTTVNRSSPVLTSGADNVIAITAGYSLAAVVKSGGTVWKWGMNGSAAVAGAAGVVDVFAGNNHLLALRNDGVVLSMGDNNFGQLGSGSVGGYNQAFGVVAGLPSITKLAGAVSHSLALDATGHVWSWGSNDQGQLGDGTRTNRATPTPVVGVSGIVAIAANDRTSFAIDGSGRLWSWGDISAVEISRCATRPAAIRLKPSNLDTDEDGLDDAWETETFGSLNHRGSDDEDGDGLSNVHEAWLGMDPLNPDTDGDGVWDAVDPDPLDYYNGSPPTLVVLGGNDQIAAPGSINPAPLDVGVWNEAGIAPLVNAPVTFTVTFGQGKLAAAPGLPEVSSLNLCTDVDGTARAYFKQPQAQGAYSEIQVTAGMSSVWFRSTSADPNADRDGNGLPDMWEQHYFGRTGISPYDDPDGDGRANLQEHQDGTDPTDYYNGNTPIVESLVPADGSLVDGTHLPFRITNRDGVLLANAPLTFTAVGQQHALSATLENKWSEARRQVTVRTDSLGIARVYVVRADELIEPLP